MEKSDDDVIYLKMIMQLYITKQILNTISNMGIHNHQVLNLFFVKNQSLIMNANLDLTQTNKLLSELKKHHKAIELLLILVYLVSIFSYDLTRDTFSAVLAFYFLN
jgi:hypothetical protein